MAQLQELDSSARAATREARVELEIVTARLKRALLPAEPRMREVEELLREAMDWEFRIRLAEIRRQVRIRQVLGDERYTRIRELVRRRQEQQRLLQQQNRTDRPLQQRQSDRPGQG